MTSTPSYTILRVPAQLINNVLCPVKNRERHLAMFLKMKATYVNSCLMDYTQARAAEAFGVSKSSARKYVNFFLGEGWCRMHHGNLVFNDLITVAKACKCVSDRPGYDTVWKQKKTVRIRVGGSMKEIVNEIRTRAVMIRRDQHNFLKTTALDCKYSKSFTPRGEPRLKAKLDMLRYYGVNENTFRNVEDKYMVGLRKIGAHIGRSTSTAHRTMNLAKERGRILYFPGHIEYLGFCRGINQDEIPGHRFIYRDILCGMKMNQYAFFNA